MFDGIDELIKPAEIYWRLIVILPAYELFYIQLGLWFADALVPIGDGSYIVSLAFEKKFFTRYALMQALSAVVQGLIATAIAPVFRGHEIERYKVQANMDFVTMRASV